MLDRDIVLFLHPVASVGYTIDKIKSNGLKCVAIFVEYSENIQTTGDYLRGCDDIITVPADPDLIVDLVAKSYSQDQVLFVLPGVDEVLPYVEKLAGYYCPQLMNPTFANTLRTHKDQLNKFLHKQNIPVAQQVVIDKENFSQLSEIVSDFNFPVFVKPATGHGASYAAKKANSLGELVAHIATYIGKESVVSKRNVDSFLLEEFLDGEEWVADVVSYAGQHYVSGLFSCDKKIINGDIVYFNMRAEPLDSPVGKIIIDYSKTVLAACQVKFGANHIEVMLTTNGPYLIEVNPRISGASGGMQLQAEWSYGFSQLEALIYAAKNQCFKDAEQDFRPSCSGFFYNDSSSRKVDIDLSGLLAEKVKVLTFTKDFVYTPGVQIVNARAIILLADSSDSVLLHDLDILRMREDNDSLFLE